MEEESFYQLLSRRKFINMAGMTAAAMSISPGSLLAEKVSSDRKIHIGIIGGGFGSNFFFHEEPNCIVEAVSDLRADRRELLMKVYKCNKSYPSLEKLILDPKIDAVFIATEAPNHHRHVMAALDAGKHVLCTVPCVMTLEDCETLRDEVKRTGLTYMMAETSYYRQNTISVRKFYQEGKFGQIISAAAEYNHPGLESYFFESNGASTWRHGLPPMNYPTHCTSFLVSVTGERLTSVSCIGWGDDSPILKNNRYENPFWNETAFFETNQKRPFRVEVNWKGAYRGTERGEWRGSKMSFFSPHGEGGDSTIVKISDQTGHDEGGFVQGANIIETYKQPLWWKTDMLPKPLQHDSGCGHGGSHTFITHEFIDALINNRQPTVNIYEAIAYTVPGIVAHQSALKGGEYMKIPNFD
jgi:predicted dehydrogenase